MPKNKGKKKKEFKRKKERATRAAIRSTNFLVSNVLMAKTDGFINPPQNLIPESKGTFSCTSNMEFSYKFTMNLLDS